MLRWLYSPQSGSQLHVPETRPLRRGKWAPTRIVTLSLRPLSSTPCRVLDQSPQSGPIETPGPNTNAWLGCPGHLTRNPSLDSLFGQDPRDGKHHSHLPPERHQPFGSRAESPHRNKHHGPMWRPVHSKAIRDIRYGENGLCYFLPGTQISKSEELL